ncbi:MAG TPA: beta-propeller fold lactonase family protein [Caulobacteraceae bacterium]|nr:beta-propeller fold lactonase family protein [Caulobacteraceae bacterium]
MQTRPLSAYVAIGPRLINFTVEVEAEQLVRRCDLLMPSRVQYLWPHPSLPILYVGCADRTEGADGQPFYLCALVRDAAGDLSFLEEPRVLPSRPIHLTVDRAARHVLVAYSAAPGLSVYELREDGTVGAEVPRAASFDFGVNPHQVRVTPGGDRAILAARGKNGFGRPTYVEGALKVLRFDRGQVETLYSITPEHLAEAYGFNPRHLDFHPSLPWVFVSLEGQSKLCVFRMEGAELQPQVLFTRDLLAEPHTVRPRQVAGTVHVHPNGMVVYVANRNDGYLNGPSWLTPDPVPVFPGGENSIAVFAIDQATGEPTLIQHMDSQGLHPRTFSLDPSGRILIAANFAPTIQRNGDALTEVPANLAVFRVGEDGKLTFVRRFDVEVGREMMLWAGLVP